MTDGPRGAFILDSQLYVDNKLKLFDVIRILNSSRIKYTDINSIKTLMIDVLVEHSALFPPTEQTYALHELIHVASQIPKVGPPKFNNLFMFERVNASLKRMIKNKCNSMPSIVKAYAVSIHTYIHMFLYVFTCFRMLLYVFLCNRMFFYVFVCYFMYLYVFVCFL